MGTLLQEKITRIFQTQLCADLRYIQYGSNRISVHVKNRYLSHATVQPEKDDQPKEKKP